MTAALQTPYCFSFVRRNNRANSFKGEEDKKEVTPPAPPTTAGYESSIKTINTVSTVEEFWQTYDYIKRPDNLPAITDLHIFRGGIKPTWVRQEDAAFLSSGMSFRAMFLTCCFRFTIGRSC
jgi:hypothetical protein